MQNPFELLYDHEIAYLMDLLPPGRRASLRASMSPEDFLGALAAFELWRTRQRSSLKYVNRPVPQFLAGSPNLRRKMAEELHNNLKEQSSDNQLENLEDESFALAESFLYHIWISADDSPLTDEANRIERICKLTHDLQCEIGGLSESAALLFNGSLFAAPNVIRGRDLRDLASFFKGEPEAAVYRLIRDIRAKSPEADRNILSLLHQAASGASKRISELRIKKGKGRASLANRLWQEPRWRLARRAAELVLKNCGLEAVSGTPGKLVYRITALAFEYALGADPEVFGNLNKCVAESVPFVKRAWNIGAPGGMGMEIVNYAIITGFDFPDITGLNRPTRKNRSIDASNPQISASPRAKRRSLKRVD